MHRKRSKKNRNSFLRWKNSRKNSAMSDSHSKRKFKGKQKLSQGKPQRYYMGNVTSEWYWSNYRKAFNYWRASQTWDDWKGLRQDHPEVEDIIRKYLPSTYAMSKVPENVTPCYSQYQAFENSNQHLKTENTDFNHHTNTEDNILNTESETSSNESDEIQLEMSEEMIEFFKVSFQHKLKLQKEKQEKEEKTDLEKKVLEMQSNRSKRNYEMKLLYGEEASKIIGMETALQLSFDKYCDTKSPKYWPNIPLRL